MLNLTLSGPQAALLAAGLAGAGVAARRLGARRPAARRTRAVAPFLFEAAVVAVLYAAWQELAGLGHSRLGVAVERGRALLHLERSLRLPSERDLQALLLPHPLLVQAANLYYAVAHFTAMGLVLLWLFVRHRERYPQHRTLLAVVTAACLAVQSFAVAPPRLLPGAGFVDTAAVYGQSVYPSLSPGQVSTLLGVDFGADQLSAMPSVHVAWALLVAVAVQTASTSRWRSLVWAHPLVTVVVIVGTGNHYWADGLVAAALFGLSGAAVTAAAALLRRRRAGDRPPPVGAAAGPPRAVDRSRAG